MGRKKYYSCKLPPFRKCFRTNSIESEMTEYMILLFCELKRINFIWVIFKQNKNKQCGRKIALALLATVKPFRNNFYEFISFNSNFFFQHFAKISAEHRHSTIGLKTVCQVNHLNLLKRQR